MGPALLQAAKAGVFDVDAWTVAERAAEARDFDQTLAAIAALKDDYATMIADMSDADFRTEIDIFGDKSSRGAFIVNQLLCGCAAYRTQLFLYLKACGREDLSTMNLWGGADAPAPPALRTSPATSHQSPGTARPPPTDPPRVAR